MEALHMRVLSILALAAATMLTACGDKGDSTANNAATPAASTGTAAAPAAPAANEGPAVTGMVMADAPAALAPGATLSVRLLDVTRAEGEALVISEKTYPVTAIPAEFSLPYNQADVNPIRTFAVEATVMDQGVVRFVSQGRVGVLTQGKPAHAKILLAGAMVAPTPKDPVEEFNKEFVAFEAQLGALKRVTGSRIEGESAAYAWDAFADDKGVRVVRETVNNADGATISQSRYAFREDGKPWIVERETGGVKTRVGWAADGTVLVHEKDGKPADVADADIEKLVKAAEAAKTAAAAKL
jgi:uncharacterized lipoprotein YbaY